MSLHLFSRIYRETAYTGATQTVLAILGGYADEYNYCTMSEARIMWESGLSERSVRNAIRELERDNVVETTRNYGRGRASIYRINIEHAPVKEDWRAFLIRTQGEAAADRYFAAVARNQVGKYRQILPVEPQEIPADFSEYRQSATENTGNLRQESEATPLKENKKKEQSLVQGVAPGGAKEKRAQKIPADWEPDDELRLWAMDERGFTAAQVREETDRFRDHFLANGKVGKDWVAAFRNWIRRAPEFSPARNGNGNANRSRDLESADEFFARREKMPRGLR
jgi:hypothetical protein